MSKLRLTLIVVALLCVSGQAQNLIQNPGFESPVRPDSYTFLHVGDDIGGVWFVTATVNDVGHVRHNSSFVALDPPPDGDQFVYVGDSGRAATIVQPISTPLAVGDYPLSFMLGTTDTVKLANARIELAPITGGSGFATTYGAAVFSQDFATGLNAQGWHLMTTTIPVTTPGSYGLFISGLDEPFVDNQTNIDSVSLLPEPGSAALLLAGLVMLARSRRRTI